MIGCLCKFVDSILKILPTTLCQLVVSFYFSGTAGCKLFFVFAITDLDCSHLELVLLAERLELRVELRGVDVVL